MIKTKDDLLFYLKEDRSRLGVDDLTYLKRFAAKLFYSERALIFSYVVRLRKTELYYNSQVGPLSKVKYYISSYRLKRLGAKLMINIGLNCTGPGLAIYHIGGITINPLVKIGSNFGLQTGVVIGQTKPNHVPMIGNNVYFGPGAKAFGKITIGNNVIVAPNSVVIKDVPDNCVVSGVPAIVIKIN